MVDHDDTVDLGMERTHSARIYDYYLGGRDNYEADRLAAAAIEEAIPTVRAVARGNREFMVRAIGHLSADLGIRQFLDIGTGIPTEPNLHQVAQAAAPDARVVYVDNDPIVLAHARVLLTGTREGVTRYVHADLTDPTRILNAPDVRTTLDFSQPIAVSVIALCHFVPGDRIYDIIDTLLAPLAPGSCLVMTHLSPDFDPQMVEGTVAAYRANGIEMEARDYDGIARFFRDLEVLEPGIVAIDTWAPGGRPRDLPPDVTELPTNTAPTPPPAAGYAAVGRKR